MFEVLLIYLSLLLILPLLLFFITSFVANIFIFSLKPDSLTNIFSVIFASSILFVNLL